MQDDGTRAAIAEQLNQHALLSRKANNMNESSSSEESSDEDDLDEASDGSDQDAAVKLLKKAKDKTAAVLEGDEELPASGVLSLPFMVILSVFPLHPRLALIFLRPESSSMVLPFHRYVD